MLHQKLYLILALYSCIIADAHLPNGIRNYQKDVPSIKSTEVSGLVSFRKEMYQRPLLLSGKHKAAQFEGEKKQQMYFNKRTKRGIIFLDEEFDVPAKTGVKHGWGGTETQTDDDVFEATIVKDTTEGSGDKEDLQIFEPTYSEFIKTTEQGIHRNLSMTSREKTSVTKETSVTFPSTSDFEGSGDDTTIQSTLRPEVTFPFSNDSVPTSCLNRTCSSNDLKIYFEEFLPEGSNATLFCASKNYTDTGMLYWYRFIGTTYTLQTYHDTEELHLGLPNARVENSGRYVCIRWIKEHFCCNREVYITVYEVPAYKYHLLTIAIVTAMCLLTCILLAIYRTRVMNKYTKQFITEQKNGKPLLLL